MSWKMNVVYNRKKKQRNGVLGKTQVCLGEESVACCKGRQCNNCPKDGQLLWEINFVGWQCDMFCEKVKKQRKKRKGLVMGKKDKGGHVKKCNIKPQDEGITKIKRLF